MFISDKSNVWEFYDLATIINPDEAWKHYEEVMKMIKGGVECVDLKMN